MANEKKGSSGKFAYSLQMQALQLADVITFAKYYEPTMKLKDAAKSLIALGVNGHEIEKARGNGEVDPKKTRREAALRVYESYFGPPTNKQRTRR